MLKKMRCAGLGLLLGIVAQGPGGGDPVPQTNAPASQSCALAALSSLADLYGREVDAGTVSAWEATLGSGASMRDIAAQARSAGLELEGYRATLAEVLDGRKAGIVHLGNPDHYLVVTGGTDDVVQVVDGGVSAVVPRRDLEARYTGQVLLVRPAEGQGRPVAFVETPDQLLTATGWEAEANYTVRVANRGGAPLTLSLHRRACSCSVVEGGEQEVGPGATASLRLRVQNPRNDSTAWVWLRTNDPDRPVVTLSLRCVVHLSVAVLPEALFFEATQGEVVTHTVRVVAPQETQIRGVAVTRSFLSAHVGKDAEKHDGALAWSVETAISAEAPVGTFEDVLTINTTDKERPVITVPIRGRVRGDLDVVPSEAFFGFVKAGDKAATSLGLRSRSGKPFQVREVRTSGPGIRATWTAPTLQVSVNTDKPGPIEGWVELTTDVPGQEMIRVPVSGLVE